MRFENFRLLLIPVIAVRNLEEWAAFPAYGSFSPALAAHRPVAMAEPPWHVLEVTWILVTVLPAALVIAATVTRRSRLIDSLVCRVASMYLANAFVPHALELTLGRAYAPGVVSALILNVPFCSLLLRQATVEHYLTRRQVAVVCGAGLLSIVPVLVAVLATATAITQALGE
jgi:hypothetical protein